MVEQTLEKGFRLTEVGVLPEDWEIKKLEQISTEIGDGIHTTPQYIDTSEIHFINGNNLANGSIKITSNTMCVSEEEYKKYRKKLGTRTILMSINGTIGNLAYFKDERVVLGKSAAYINLDNSVNKEYIFYLLQTTGIKNFYENELTGTTIRNLSLRSLKNTPVSLPPTKEEQTGIAQVLSDMDDLIELLDKLIEKKKNVKQGAMQELFTGKKRLPGFSEEWKVKKLCEIFLLTSGKTKSKFVENGGRYLIMDMGSVSVEGKNISNKSTNYNKDLLEYGDLVMPKDDIGGGNIIGKTVFIDKNSKYVLGDHVYKLKSIDPKTNTLFYSYLINGHQTNTELKKKAVGSAQLGLNRKSVEDQEVKTTTDIEEQIAIAQVLSDMDLDIEWLEQKRDKCGELKAGMMQQLLTGRIRLKWTN